MSVLLKDESFLVPLAASRAYQSAQAAGLIKRRRSHARNVWLTNSGQTTRRGHVTQNGHSMPVSSSAIYRCSNEQIIQRKKWAYSVMDTMRHEL